jgi:hypothetical protein
MLTQLILVLKTLNHRATIGFLSIHGKRETNQTVEGSSSYLKMLTQEAFTE